MKNKYILKTSTNSYLFISNYDNYTDRVNVSLITSINHKITKIDNILNNEDDAILWAINKTIEIKNEIPDLIRYH